MYNKLLGLTTALAFAALPVIASADTVLGKVETLYMASSQHMLVEYTPGTRTHDRNLVADVVIRDGAGTPARHVLLPLADEPVERGDIVAINEGERGNALRTAPLRARDRIARIEAKYDTELARNFFRKEPSNFLAALKKDD